MRHIAHLINTDAGSRGVLELYLEYVRKNPDFLRKSVELLLNNTERVLVITGFPIPPKMIPETDGPPGALALVKAIEKLGGNAELLTYPEIEVALRNFGVKFSRDYPSRYTLIIGVETPGRGPDGRAYSMRGIPIDREIFDWIFMKAKETGIPTIGIGDGGNEVGMGNIRELVVRHVKHGIRIGSIVETDELILSAVSNWGVYGLVAGLSLEVGKNLLKGWNEEEVMVTMVNAGLIDGVKGTVSPSVDGLSLELNLQVVELLKTLVEEML